MSDEQMVDDQVLDEGLDVSEVVEEDADLGDAKTR